MKTPESFFYISRQGAKALAKNLYKYAKTGDLTLSTGAKLRYSIQKDAWYVQSFHYAREDIAPFLKYKI